MLDADDQPLPPDLADDDIAVLTELRDLAMRAARALTDEIEAAVLPESGVDAAGKATLTQAMTRAARAVRQAIALKRRLAEGRKFRTEALREAESEAREAAARDLEDAQSEAEAEAGCARKEEAFLLAHDQISEQASESEREDLFDDLREWVRGDEYDESYAAMSVGEIIDEIKGELQVDPNWRRLSDEVCEYEDLRARHEARLQNAAQSEPRLLEAHDPP